MKAATFYAPGDLRVGNVPEPTAGPGELKLRMHATATCGTDAKIFRHGHHRLEPPQIIGHELAGEVIEIGDGVSGFTPGDRVQVIAAVPCGTCWACTSGAMTVCPNQTSMGYQYPGGFAEQMVVPAAVLAVDGVNRIPGGVSYAEAAVTEPLACALNAQELVRVGPGDVVVVMGAGPIGCLHVRLARSLGATTVYLVDVNADRLAMSAERVSPDAAVDATADDPVDAIRKLTGGRGPTVVVTAAPAGSAQEQAIEMAAPQGRISFFGGLPKDDPYIRCDSNLVHYRELSLVGANGSSPAHNRRALELIARGAVPVADLITHRLPLDDIHAAIEAVMSGTAIKVVVEP